MTTWRITWAVCPFIRNEARVNFVEAESPDAAWALLKDKIEHDEGHGWIASKSIEPYKPPTHKGRIL